VISRHPALLASFCRLGLGLSLTLAACGGAAPTPPPPPLRPAATPVEPVGEAPSADRATDCPPTDLNRSPPSVPYRLRSLDEAQNLANHGFDKLAQAERRDTSKSMREQLITQAVDDFVTALRADPYNVHATYNLSAAYARIGRNQCALNLLDRLAALYKLEGYRWEVDIKLDRLLGRGKFVNDLDPDFRILRDREGFREIVKKFEGT
jgi:hypothetical protein